MECRMDGRVALITGSSLGLGRAMAFRFAGAGAHVVIVGRRRELVERTVVEVEAAGPGKVLACVADVSRAEDIDRMVDETEAALGPVEILVNNAGASNARPFEEIGDEIWAEDFELKFYAAVRAARRVLPGMTARRWGRIVNVLNIYAKAQPGRTAPTSVTRAAGMAMSKVLAAEAASHNVLVNALLVGRIESDQWRRRWEAGDRQESYDAYLDRLAIEARLPMGRMGTAEEFANIACFLCSEQASYITGCAINVDGGMSLVS